MYLDGRGIHRRTRELTDAVWDKLLHAIAGSTLAIGGPVVTCGLLLHRFSWEPPVSPEQKIVALTISVACLGGGILIAQPWYKAKRTLDEHTESLRRETEQRGEGWARD